MVAIGAMVVTGADFAHAIGSMNEIWTACREMRRLFQGHGRQGTLTFPHKACQKFALDDASQRRNLFIFDMPI